MPTSQPQQQRQPGPQHISVPLQQAVRDLLRRAAEAEKSAKEAK